MLATITTVPEIVADQRNPANTAIFMGLRIDGMDVDGICLVNLDEEPLPDFELGQTRELKGRLTITVDYQHLSIDAPLPRAA